MDISNVISSLKEFNTSKPSNKSISPTEFTVEARLKEKKRKREEEAEREAPLNTTSNALTSALDDALLINKIVKERKTKRQKKYSPVIYETTKLGKSDLFESTGQSNEMVNFLSNSLKRQLEKGDFEKVTLALKKNEKSNKKSARANKKHKKKLERGANYQSRFQAKLNKKKKRRRR